MLLQVRQAGLLPSLLHYRAFSATRASERLLLPPAKIGLVFVFVFGKSVDKNPIPHGGAHRETKKSAAGRERF